MHCESSNAPVSAAFDNYVLLHHTTATTLRLTLAMSQRRQMYVTSHVIVASDCDG
jgi:hypothetical protein